MNNGTPYCFNRPRKDAIVQQILLYLKRAVRGDPLGVPAPKHHSYQPGALSEVVKVHLKHEPRISASLHPSTKPGEEQPKS